MQCWLWISQTLMKSRELTMELNEVYIFDMRWATWLNFSFCLLLIILFRPFLILYELIALISCENLFTRWKKYYYTLYYVGIPKFLDFKWEKKAFWLRNMISYEKLRHRKKERKKDILTSFKRPKWPIRPNKRLHLKCFLVFENKSK